MVGVTCINNLNAPAGKQISLYYNLTNRNLGLQQRNESNWQDPPTNVYVSDVNDQDGWIENPSQVASADLTGLPLVFGFTEKRADPLVPKQLKHDVAILSPVYRPIGETLKDNKTISAVSDGESSSVFFLTYVHTSLFPAPYSQLLFLFIFSSLLFPHLANIQTCFRGGNGNAIHIEEAIVGQIMPEDWSGTAVIMKDSSIASYYAGPGIRRIIYQADNNSDVHDYRPNEGCE